ncbi:MAG TPA: hypothetical protein VGR66_02810 [Candidatus Eisenbacteria bacterium]|jgi:hypothetical protein|nr:hypothetical protein [Candidatus Eisenbacteria bacterium]
MRPLTLSLALLVAAATAFAQDSTSTPSSTSTSTSTDADKPLRVIMWSELKAQGAELPGTIMPPTDDRPFEVLRVANQTGKPRTITVFTLAEPGITESKWMFSGEVHYEKVLGKAYLELLNQLTDGQTYFSRTLQPDGPMAWITGNSGWRPFALPFNAWKPGNRPTKIVFNVVLPQRGVIDLSPIEVHEGFAASP